MARLKCPVCTHENTWAHYVHEPCPGSPTGKNEWEAEAIGATPDGKPLPAPCPLPGDGTLTQASKVMCRDCNHEW